MIEPMSSGDAPGPGSGFEAQLGTAQTTGRFIVVFAEDDADPAAMLAGVAGLSNVANSRDFEGQATDMAASRDADATVFSELGMAVVTADPEQLGAMQTSAQAQGNIVAVAPELIHHVLPDPAEYIRGYREAVDDLSERLSGTAASTSSRAAAGGSPSFADNDQATWGLQATGVLASGMSGKGIRVAVLDTGLDLTHPDFAGRSITPESFIAGVSAQDGHGHGTHCIGTSCGPRSPAGSRRYGIAYEAEIYAGKVLSDQGSGSDSGILAGINWAVANDCQIISMSLGADVPNPHPPYTLAGQRALRRGTLIIAAAGNNASRPGDPGFVGAPANSPDIMAVGALDSQLAIAGFSARSLPGRGGQVDIAGPGVNVYSSWPVPLKYRSISGTSMATPHAAGIAALWSQATGRRSLKLWATLTKESQRLREASLDVGSGLILAAP